MDQKLVFRDFFTRKYLEYEARLGRRVTITEFADALSLRAESGEVIGQIFQGDVSHWLKGTRLPGPKLLKILAQSPIIGPECWRMAGYEFEVDDLSPMEAAVLENLQRLPPAMQAEAAQMIENMAKKAGREQPRQYAMQTTA